MSKTSDNKCVRCGKRPASTISQIEHGNTKNSIILIVQFMWTRKYNIFKIYTLADNFNGNEFREISLHRLHKSRVTIISNIMQARKHQMLNHCDIIFRNILRNKLLGQILFTIHK